MLKLTKSIILAAGLGTRMRPLTDTLPKPLIPVNGKPLIDWCMEWLRDAGIAEAVINSSYRAAQLEAYVTTKHTLCVQFSREEPGPLETGGGIAKALSLLGSAPFLAMNSDAIFPKQNIHPVARLVEAWRDDADFVMLLVPRDHAIGWEKTNGDFITDGAGRIRRPRAGEEATAIFTGVEIIHPRAFVGCPEGAFSLSSLWNAHVDSEGWFTRIRTVMHEGAWLNVGDLAGLKAAQDYGGGAATGNCA